MVKPGDEKAKDGHGFTLLPAVFGTALAVSTDRRSFGRMSRRCSIVWEQL